MGEGGEIAGWLSFRFICRVMEVEDVRESRGGSWVGTQIIIIMNFSDYPDPTQY